METVVVLGGTGNEGLGLALRWAKSGKYRVLIGSRQAEKGERVAHELNTRLGRDLIRGASNEDAAREANLCVLTIPYSAHAATLTGLHDVLQGRILIDVTVPLKPPKVSQVYIPPGGSAGQEAQAILGPGVRVVSAFQNVGMTHLAEDEPHIDCDVLVCGDDRDAKAAAISLAEAAGMRGIDAGPLQNGIVVEGLTSILIGINMRYKVKGAGIKITGI